MKQSLGRFGAILAIVALGVAFYAGLTVTKSAMVETTEHYLDEHNFYDYRLLSTSGFRQEEVAFLQAKESVERVEGAVAFDIIYQKEDGSDAVLKAHSIPEEINRLELIKGRMPEKANECVVDSNLFAEAAIGKTLNLSEHNTEEDLDYFEYREYQIVGIVQSPLYIQFERGNTSLGSGTISGFVYIPYEGFHVDFYSEIYVKFTDDFPLYSEEYQDFLKEKETVWEAYAEEAAHLSYEGIQGEAASQLSDAKAELEKEKAETEADLADVAEQLSDAKRQLSDGEAQLLDAKEELQKAKATLVKKEDELAAAETEIAQQEKELEVGEAALEAGKTEWNLNQDRLDSSRLELLLAQAQLTQQKAELQSAESDVLMAETTLVTAEAALNVVKELYGEESSEFAEQEKSLRMQRQN